MVAPGVSFWYSTVCLPGGYCIQYNHLFVAVQILGAFVTLLAKYVDHTWCLVFMQCAGKIVKSVVFAVLVRCTSFSRHRSRLLDPLLL
jgi:hypothetical protein